MHSNPSALTAAFNSATVIVPVLSVSNRLNASLISSSCSFVNDFFGLGFAVRPSVSEGSGSKWRQMKQNGRERERKKNIPFGFRYLRRIFFGMKRGQGLLFTRFRANEGGGTT